MTGPRWAVAVNSRQTRNSALRGADDSGASPKRWPAEPWQPQSRPRGGCRS